MTSATERGYARELDRRDPLASFRRRFIVDDPDLIYLDGNSLGRLPKATATRLKDLIEQEWGQQLIRGWNQGWMEAPERIGSKIAQLIGARADEVIVADSTSINLFKLAVAALQAQPDRHKIVTDDLNFPSDHHVLQGIQALLQRPVEIHVARSPDGIHGPLDALYEAIDRHTALVTLSHVAYKTSYAYDLQTMTERAQHQGAFMLWDLSHSVGSLPVRLNDCAVPLAVGCTYKHLNGGPGAPAFLYVRRDLQLRLANPIPGWMGKRNVFDFDPTYQPDQGIRRFLTGTPSILSLCAIEPAIELFLEAGMERVREKSVLQTEYLIELWRAWLAPLGFSLNSPLESASRGAHVSLGHPHGLSIDQALIQEMKVIPDFRPPDTLRFGACPLYTSFEDIFEGMSRLRTTVIEKRFEKYTQAPLVT